MIVVWMLLALIVAVGLAGGAKAWGLWRELQTLRTIVAKIQTTPAVTPTPEADLTPYPGAGAALAHPPTSLDTALAYIRRTTPADQRYTFPLGWYLTASGQAGCVTSSFVGDVNHLLVSGQTDSGKDNQVLGALLALTAQYTPEQLQICIVDGKGLDWAEWGDKAHTWNLAMEPEEIAPIMKELTAERQRRRRILQAARVTKWDEYTGNDLPLLVVYVSELLLLQNATSKSVLTAWLNAELTAARAFGIRYIIATQTASNFDTQWRSQISLFLAGQQPAPSQDAPNTGMTTAELRALGLIPPSDLPAGKKAAGIFTAVQGREGETIRAPLIDTNQRRRWLDTLPLKATKPLQQRATARTTLTPNQTPSSDLLNRLLTGQPLPFTDEALTTAGSAASGHSNGMLHASPALHASQNTERDRPSQASGEALTLDIPMEEIRRITEGAKTAASRRALCQQLYNTTGGKKYEWVRSVCDTAGLLMPTAPGQAVAA